MDNSSHAEQSLPLVDSHAHLDDQQFDPDRNEMLQRAREAGVSCHSGHRL